MSYVLAIDAGTTGVRAFALGDDGAVRGYAYREFPQHFPRPGWVEHDADDIWSTTEVVLAEVVDAHGRPAAIGITNQRETVVAWSRSTGRPVARAIVWQDRRTAERCDALAAAGHLDLVRRRTGLVLDPYFSGTKIAWLLAPDGGGVEAGPDLAVGTVDSWLVWKLTDGAVHATEPSNACRTMLYDIVERRWSAELCDLLGVPMDVLPEVRPSVGDFGLTAGRPELAGIPIAGILGDQQAALFGQACLDPGMAKNTFGTGSFVLANVGPSCPEPVEGLLTTVAWELADGTVAYALEGAVFVTGAAVQWLRDGLGILDDCGRVSEALAASVPDSGGLVLVPAFTGLGSPWWDPYARGALLGITRGSTAAHLARATLESMAFQTRDVLDAMSAAAGLEVKELRVDGGASANGLLLQLVADQVQVPVTRPVIAETTALGAAYAAGLGTGLWSSPADVTAAWRADVVVEPATDRAAADAAHGSWLRAVERSGGWERPR